MILRVCFIKCVVIDPCIVYVSCIVCVSYIYICVCMLCDVIICSGVVIRCRSGMLHVWVILRVHDTV